MMTNISEQEFQVTANFDRSNVYDHLGMCPKTPIKARTPAKFRTCHYMRRFSSFSKHVFTVLHSFKVLDK